MIKLKSKTLSRDYFIFAAIVAIVIIGISGWRTYQAYNSIETDKQIRYESEADKITVQMSESINYLERFMALLANEISRLDTPDPEKIAPILQKGFPRIENSGFNYFAWSILDFSDADGRELASSLSGVIRNRIMLPKDRIWITEGPNKPGELLFSAPDFGVLTGQYILPVGYGVVNKQGKYLGAISISFNLRSLTKKFESSVRPETSLLMIDNNMNIIVESGSDTKALPVNFLRGKLDVAKLGKEGNLDKPIVYEDISYSYYKRLPNYPFIVLVGDNKYFQNREVNRLLGPRIEQSIILGIFFLLLLYFFQRRIIRPVQKLSEAAVAISNGNTDVEMPKTDILEYQLLAQQLGNIREIISRLNKAQRDLEEALKAKSSFLSNMSHEFRTPLNAVIGFSETIKKRIFGDIGNDKYSEYVENINEQGIYLLKLIEEILDASKIESGNAQIHDEPFSFNRLVKDCIKTVQQRADDKKIQMLVDMNEDLPYLKADKIKIKQVLLNLLSNAIKFTSDNGKVNIRAYVENGFVIEVQDSGIGIEKDDLKRIAQRFAQVDNIYTRKNRGTGLGMSISKDIIEMHGGQFLIESEVNIGTKIIIRLPQERVIFGSFYTEGK